jgi:membrane protein implicated in regulation of membrane protease activity
VALVLIAAEVASGQFVLLMLGGGALVAAGVAALAPGSPVLGGVAFALASLVLLFAARPALKRRLDRGMGAAPLHTQALVGRGGVVLQRVDAHGGRVRIGGDEWSARPLVEHDVIEAGTAVTVMRISGATALVVAAG